MFGGMGMRLSWGKVDPEVRAMLPHTLDALDEILRETPDVFPHSSATGRMATTPAHRRGDDGRVCGPLLDMGGCMAALSQVPGTEIEIGRFWSATRVQGTVETPPLDDFRVLVSRRPDRATFQMWVETPVGRQDAVCLQGAGLFRKASWECRATSGAWGSQQFRDQDVAHMLRFAVNLRREGSLESDLLASLYAERALLGVRVKRELGGHPDDLAAAAAVQTKGMGR